MSHDLRPGRRGKSFVFERDLKTSSESAEQMCQVWQVIPRPEAQLPSGFQPSVGGGISSSSQQLIGQSQCLKRLRARTGDVWFWFTVRRHGADKYNGSSSNPNKALRVKAWLAVFKVPTWEKMDRSLWIKWKWLFFNKRADLVLELQFTLEVSTTYPDRKLDYQH